MDCTKQRQCHQADANSRFSLCGSISAERSRLEARLCDARRQIDNATLDNPASVAIQATAGSAATWCNDAFVRVNDFTLLLYKRLYPVDPAVFVLPGKKFCLKALIFVPTRVMLFDTFSKMERPPLKTASPTANTWGSGSATRGSGTPGCPLPIGSAREGISEPGIG
mmetsp:Transcript_11151/g.21573  ORF Transcript_11151/g.21573 Transcript_11151/m.21573 type:complete len:167 (-) Transcript_11151:803-1303(-)